MKPAKKKPYPATIQGETDYYRYTLTMTIQSSVEDAGKYTIECERWSKQDGLPLEKSMIITDHHNRAFNSLEQVKKFVEEDAENFWREKLALANNDHSFFEAEQKIEAWSNFLQSLNNYIATEGEPLNKQTSIN